MSFSELKENHNYVISKKKYGYKSELYHVIIIFKGKHCCLIEYIAPKNFNKEANNNHREWIKYSNDNFTEIVEELTKIDREDKINNIKGE